MIDNNNNEVPIPPQPISCSHSPFAVRDIIWSKWFAGSLGLLALVIIAVQVDGLRSAELRSVERYNQLDGRVTELEVTQSTSRTSAESEVATLKSTIENLRNDLAAASARPVKRLIDIPLTLMVSNEVAYNMMMNSDGAFQDEFRTFAGQKHNTAIANVMSEFFTKYTFDRHQPNTLLFNLHLVSKNERVRFLRHIYFASGNVTMESVQHDKPCRFQLINYLPPLGEQYNEILTFNSCNGRPIGQCINPPSSNEWIRIMQTC